MTICPQCKKEAKRVTKGVCHNYYRRFIWKPKLRECKRCKKVRKIHALGYCNGCYASIFFIDKIKVSNAKRYHHIPEEIYRKVIDKCVICGFNKIVEIHHLDHNHKNNSLDNLTGLCPNCHKMLHHRDYQKEIFEKLVQKGFKVPKSYKPDGYYKNNISPTIHKHRFAKK